MDYDLTTTILITITSIIIIVCSFGIIIANKFQRKQAKKYKEVNKLINEKKDAIFQIKDGLTIEEVKNIDNDIDINKLSSELFSTYLELENKIKSLDNDLNDILFGDFNELISNKIEILKSRNMIDANDAIELVNYSITRFTPNELDFRININCFSYKMINGVVSSGSNMEKVEKIILLTFTKSNDKWLISSYDDIYERKLSN